MNRRRAAPPLSLALVAAFALPLAAQAPPSAPKTMELGKGPTVVIVHDLGGSRSSWMPTVRRLLPTHRVVLVDLPGHGESPLPDPFSLEAAAAAIDQVLAKQNPDSTVLVGKGMAGLVLMHALAAQPQRARGLVVIDAGLKAPLAITDQQRKRFNEWMDANYDAFLRMTMGRLGSDSAQSVAIHAQAALTPAVTMKSYMRAALAGDGGAALAKLARPPLFVATDRVFRPGPGSTTERTWDEAARSLGYPDPARIPMRRLRDAGYLAMSEQPDSLAAILREFSAAALAR